MSAISKALTIKSFVLYPSPFKLLRCWLRSLTHITYYFVGSRGFAYLPPSSNLKCSGYIRKLKK
ncbi:MAG: hypothetical protein QS721_12800 [Candidatus Endonucleobacter sp. (ex Gigantidas childressi)]|nr:hypothetical protein [Candidatus Endonucleobacter sp. (ex Gigantidas childressi)]